MSSTTDRLRGFLGNLRADAAGAFAPADSSDAASDVGSSVGDGAFAPAEAQAEALSTNAGDQTNTRRKAAAIFAARGRR